MPPVSSELDAGASTNAPASNDVLNMRQHAVEPTPEGYMGWLIERCERRYNNAETRERRILYGERVTLLHGLQSAMTSGHPGLRAAALRSLGGMSDISDQQADAANRDEDEDSSDGYIETPAEQRARHMNSEQCGVSDPELWVLHYGEGVESESDAS
eukprot:s412_g14.t1